MKLSSTFLIRWSWLLSVALLAPAALPAGGAERHQPQLRRRSDRDQRLFTVSSTDLRLSPVTMAPVLRNLAEGTQLRVLRRWRGDDGQHWFHVQELTGENCRGWMRA
ncbi:SH3 domain-containing protein [Synechococcus sp. MIT S1220]|uniref:SH3 domain-containing protein n=1 Tax=Synechococcus sp. MIT S1220 TaxID=3082549 RepID=UPI0039B05E62